MAQHPPIASIATTTGITSSAMSIYMHHAWQALLIMSSVSLVLISFGHVRLLLGKHALAKQQVQLHRKLSVKKLNNSNRIHIIHKMVQLLRPYVMRICFLLFPTERNSKYSQLAKPQ